MARQAVIAEIIDLSMLILHFGLVVLMTAIAVVSVVVIIGVAQLTLLVGSTVIQREGVVKAGRFPCIRAVTLRALAAEMVCWRVPAVAGDTVRCPCRTVIEGCRQPGAGAVTGRTLSRIMVCRLVSAMAGDTIRRPSCIMIEGGRQPGIRAVAG